MISRWTAAPKWLRWHNVLLVVLVFIIIFSLVWFLVNKDAVVISADRHAGMAGWVQAIGALLAIFATWFWADLQRRQEKEKRTAEIAVEQRRHGDRVHAVANLIGLSVSRARAYIERAEVMVSVTDYGISLGKFSQRELIDHLLIPYEPPQDIIQVVEVLPRTAAKDVLQFYFFIKTYNLYVQDWTPLAGTFAGPIRAEYIEKFEIKLRAMKKIVGETWEELLPHFGEHDAPDASGPKVVS